MKPEAIVYTSNTGFTRRYADMLGKKTGLPVYEISNAKEAYGRRIIYMGWLMAGTVKDYARAAKKFDVQAVCGIGLSPTGALLKEVRNGSKIPEKTALFTMQGGMDHSKLKGLYKFMINMLVKVLSGKKDKSQGESAMLKMIIDGGDFVNEKNLSDVYRWFKAQR